MEQAGASRGDTQGGMCLRDVCHQNTRVGLCLAPFIAMVPIMIVTICEPCILS